jgi:hypothetical protein
LARKYPWLEVAYAAAYAAATANANAMTVVTSPTGRLGRQFDPSDPEPSVWLLRTFLQRIQWPPEAGAAPLVPPPPVAPLPNAPDWVPINEANQTREHATWLTSDLLEEILGEELKFSHVGTETLRGKSSGEQVRQVLAQSGRYVAVTREEFRFDYLIDRSLLLEQVARSAIAEGTKS